MNDNPIKKWLIAYLRQPFHMIVWVMETFAKNRKRVAAFMAREGVVRVFKTVVIATFFIWLAVFAFLSSREEGNRFGCAVKSLMSDADMTGCEAQPWQKPAKAN
jgi:hypothetical protein